MPQNIIEARREIVKFGNSSILWLDGYLVDGAVKYAPTRVSEFLFERKNVILQVTKTETKRLLSWQDKGFTGYKTRIQIAERGDGIRGASLSDTISSEDFRAIVLAEAERGNPKAKALLAASFAEVQASREREAFGLLQLTEEAKQSRFSEEFDQWGAIYAENREEVEQLHLAGDLEEYRYQPSLWDGGIHQLWCDGELVEIDWSTVEEGTFT
ncbi:MAG: hypothetical protein KME30_32545 [Iphinoe sp. HA4291-MV1]|jgi:hypothetical protein|nr:hypothetical protein [Iphinoe sp. HA4291-MV1]